MALASEALAFALAPFANGLLPMALSAAFALALLPLAGTA